MSFRLSRVVTSAGGFRESKRKKTADVGGSSKSHFVDMLRISSSFCHYVAYNGFCQVVSNQLCPDLLLYKFHLIRMEDAQSNRVFELSERCFDPPSGKIKTFDILCGELSAGRLVIMHSKEPSSNGNLTTRTGIV